ncbi:Mycothiol acetyltransferase [Symmachiella macrocystis]|uniref:Mycothiol acetyltransferase n=1 Tax=Symmachiella macrocystis TaxID=2527985 RepID=A0A5C6BAS8_9PLAN|nr:GNAT family N-acetyltransferase [Symmachiella macrocystis]TWU09355.1 Mycothiol acetyltransferase [Symmachiella macrocystis]
MPTPHTREFQANEWPLYREIRLRALADSPEAFGSTLAGEQAHPESWWVDRLLAGVASVTDLPLVAEVDGEPAGLSWGRIEPDQPDTAYVYQVWVAPDRRGRGVGRLLLESVLVWAKGQRVGAVELSVTCGDTPARQLYDRSGFVPFGAPELIRPGAELLEQPMRLELDNGNKA